MSLPRWHGCNQTTLSVKAPPADVAPAVARDLVVLELELVVVRELLADGDVALRVERNLLAPRVRDDARFAVGVAAVVDEARERADARRVDDELVVDAEQVVDDARFLVPARPRLSTTTVFDVPWTAGVRRSRTRVSKTTPARPARTRPGASRPSRSRSPRRGTPGPSPRPRRARPRRRPTRGSATARSGAGAAASPRRPARGYRTGRGASDERRFFLCAQRGAGAFLDVPSKYSTGEYPRGRGRRRRTGRRRRRCRAAPWTAARTGT